MLCVSLTAWAFKVWKSTVLRGLPFFFLHITILWHHVTGFSTLHRPLRTILPVERDWNRCMVGNWDCIRIDHEFHRRAFQSLVVICINVLDCYRSSRYCSSLRRFHQLQGIGSYVQICGGELQFVVYMHNLYFD